MLKDEIEKKKTTKKKNNHSSQYALTFQTRYSYHEIMIALYK